MKLKLPNIVTILILTTLTAVTWISLNIYRAVTLQPEATVPIEVSEPLNPVLDRDTINEIKSRQFISPDEVLLTVIIATPTPTPTEAPTQTPAASAVATQTAEASTTPSPTGGGTQ